MLAPKQEDFAMAGTFMTRTKVEATHLDWGSTAFVSNPATTQAQLLTVMEVILTPGKGHNFHKHPDQEEVISVVEGRIEQWLEQKRQELGPGESVFIPAGVVHASFNISNSAAKLMVVLAPCVGETGYEVVDVADQAPWNTLRS
jgi:quercetin dioxygenase-like cupin family protein